MLMADPAQFVPITPPKDGGGSLIGNLFGDNANIGDMLNTAFLIAINAGAILAMMRLIYGGWLYMGRSDMWSNKHHAKEVIQNAVFGLLILLAIWIILNQINPQILQVGSFEENLRGE